MLIHMNQQHEYVSDHVVEIFPHLTRELALYVDDDDARRFCRKLKEEIINFDTSKLQTQVIYIFLYDRDVT